MFERFGIVGRPGRAWLALLVGFAVVSWTPVALAWADEETTEAAASDAEGSQEKAAAQKSGLAWVIEAMGIYFFVAQLGVGIAIVALILTNVIGVLRGRFINDAFVGQFEGMVKNRQFKEAFELSKSENNFLGKVMVAGMSRLSDGYGDSIAAMQETGAAENMKNEHRLSMLAMLANVATLVGLLGTVVGMVASFGKLSIPGQQASPQELAKGVNQALVTTVVGLIEAIPAIVGFTILTNWNMRRVNDVAMVAENLMRPFKQVAVGRKPAGAPPPPAAAAAPAAPSPGVAPAPG